MNRPRIYSDFNGPLWPDCLLLYYNGTVQDLREQQLELREGMEVTLYADADEKEDLEIDGLVEFGDTGHPGFQQCWFVRTTGRQVRFVIRPDQEGPA
jgi:hypothetical protein